MTGSKPYYVPHEMKSVWLYIESYDDKQLKGYLRSAYYPHKCCFSNLVQFLFLMEHLLDELKYPQRGTEQRLFIPREGQHFTPALCQDEEGEEKALAKFQLSVLFRQYSSWQGVLLWIDRKQEMNFRSVLELVGLLDNALTADNAPIENTEE